tara:strand:- start:261 stop:608 length:348 start_codon:yes stop_codon:yes gene_type:complete
MHKEKLNKKKHIFIFGEKAKRCKTDHEKIEFFDSHQRAFFIDSINAPSSKEQNMPKDLEDAYYVYANMKRLTERELEELRNLPWNEYPEILKIFLFDFCILNGDVYSSYFINHTN